MVMYRECLVELEMPDRPIDWRKLFCELDTSMSEVGCQPYCYTSGQHPFVYPFIFPRTFMTVDELTASVDSSGSIRAIICWATASTSAMDQDLEFFSHEGHIQFRFRSSPCERGYSERECDLFPRWERGILQFADRLGATRIRITDMEDDHWENVLHPPFSLEDSFFEYDYFREQQVGYWDRYWLWLKEDWFPVEESPYGTFRLWTGGKRGSGVAVPLNFRPYSGSRIEGTPKFDWRSTPKRDRLRSTIWQIKSADQLFESLGCPEIWLGPIEHTQNNYRDDRGIGIAGQYGYTTLLDDAIVIVREWIDGLFTVRGIEK